MNSPRAVTVIGDSPGAALVGEGAATGGGMAERAAGAARTAVGCDSNCPFTCAETVLVSATVELSVPVATPFESVGAVGAVSVFPAPVAESVTVAPGTGLPCASRALTVIVDVSVPAVIGEVLAITLDSVSETPLWFTVTAAVWSIVTPLIVAPTVFDSATVELRFPVATPLAFVGPAG